MKSVAPSRSAQIIEDFRYGQIIEDADNNSSSLPSAQM
uniref:Uncharacterized protein n=1 Tax=Arundo donax TaxID=35708 RepID=A0A0A8ZAV4_ARUDO